MFLGRDTYAAKIKDSLVGTIYKHDSNINQAVNRLLRHGSEYLVFQRKYRKEKTPGREAEIIIRGGSSIHNSNAPLIIIDGLPRRLEDINPRDIESLEILKDALQDMILKAIQRLQEQQQKR